ncbi:MAG: hypothetical protein CSA49_05980 [Gammaproteobacteria bacterium]|nr:MAG: hypothetical protein CSA49_05980 [Gammaproteobacteria bacterium]
MVDRPIRIGIVAGEMSGDLLGAGLIQSIKQLAPQAEFIGIGGPKMIGAGCRSLFPMERLSVMGVAAALAACDRASSAASSPVVPMRVCAASSATITLGPTAPRAMRAVSILPAPSSDRAMPTPTTAMSISVRGVKRK